MADSTDESRDRVLATNPRTPLVERSGAMHLRAGDATVRLSSSPAVIRALVRDAEGTRSARVAAAVRDGHPREVVEATVDELLRAGVLVVLGAGAGPDPESVEKTRAKTGPRLEVLGAGTLAAAIAARLSGMRFEVRTRDALLPSEDRDVLVWAHEGASLGDALAANDEVLRRGQSALFVLVTGDEAAIGPLIVPGLGPCLRCALEESVEPSAMSGVCPPPVAASAAEEVTALLHGALLPLGPSPWTRERVWRSAWVGSRRLAVSPRGGCPSCARALQRPGPFDTAAALALGEGPRNLRGGASREPGPRRRVAVVGGGTAGYLTALALERERPDLAVTLLESSEVPIVGVGEATTPALVEMLLQTLGVDELALYREVAPTWKLGIRFFWGEPGPSVFHHPFAGERLLDAMVRAGDQDLQSLGAQLMARRLSPILREPDGTIVPLLGRVPYAWHLDNERFVRFLHRLADRRGIERIDCHIEEVLLDEDGSVSALRARDGRTFEHDFYVDASGFSSLLLEKALGEPFRSFDKTLFCDTAIVADVPRDGPIASYTLAETMDAGWCWSIPTPEADHRGYVLASSFCSLDEAEAEMRRKNPGMGDARVVRFRSGRLERCWQRNVFAVGNAYAFVEPLESTALHMLVHQVRLLVAALPRGSDAEDAATRVNTTIAGSWDTLRSFLALHFRFNRKLDTPFWRECREHVDLCGGEAMVAAFQHAAPLSARSDRALLSDSLLKDSFFGLLGIDNVLFGQAVPTRLPELEGEDPAFDRWVQRGLPMLLSRALPHDQGLDAYARWLAGER